MSELVVSDDIQPLEESGITRVIYESKQIGRSFWDMLHGIRYPVLSIVVIILISVINVILGFPLNMTAVFAGFFVIGFASWFLFPHAQWSWTLDLNLIKGKVSPAKLEIKDAQRLLDRAEARRIFTDANGRAVIVLGDSLPISEAHVISELDYLTDITTIGQAISVMKPIIVEYAVLKKYRGLEVSTLASRVTKERAKVTEPVWSDALRDANDDLEFDDIEEEDVDTEA